MNLDPTVSPWIGIFASTGVCLWMAAIGAPLAQAVFGDRPRPVWPFYAPILGVVAVLLTTNLAAYVAPGAVSAWVGLLVPSALSAAVALRGRELAHTFQRSAFACLALALPAAGAFLWVLANYTHMWFGDPHWHLALVQHLARGGFPPITPYGVDSGISYHYGTYLLAASIVNAAAVPALDGTGCPCVVPGRCTDSGCRRVRLGRWRAAATGNRSGRDDRPLRRRGSNGLAALR